MRKMQKEQAEEFVELLGQAHKEIGGAIQRENISMAIELLMQCQEGALKLGELIEASEGEGFVTVFLLEEYCEFLYQVYAEIDKADYLAAENDAKDLDNHLKRIDQSIQKDIAVKLEVVFLPYKASMWDSLESVWMAARDDENCDAYVIPIPYYDKNPDGSFRARHYEGSSYPDYVPITKYDDYDFERRRPDIIYIHNPYDECNYVTSVYPSFYSEKLREVTDLLVYIPYFILDEIDPEKEDELERIKHFCTLPGVFHADKVIVQSEKMRQAYINVLSKVTGEDTRRYWEQKIDSSVSPKIIKLLNTKKEELKIPEHWIKLIQKPDGSWKKIVFYNTSIAALLEHGEKMLEKMKMVFQLFKENLDEIVLLWRPHPLIEATMESMRPLLWMDYKRLVQQYQQEGFGIYDNSSDIDRAVILCDAYYGDPSSVVQLCQKVNKPYMIQNVEVTGRIPDKIFLWFVYAYIDKSSIWFSGNDFNGLYKANLDTGDVKQVAQFPEEKKVQDYLFTGVCCIESKLYFLPGAAKKMAVYDMEKNKFSTVEIPYPKSIEVSSIDKISFGIKYEDRLFIFGENLCIYEFDIEKKKVIYCKDNSDVIRKICPDKKFFSVWYAIENNIVYLSIWNSNVVVIFNLKDKNIEIKRIGREENQYIGLVKKGNKIFLAEKNSIVLWDIQKDLVKKLELEKINKAYSKIINCGGQILLSEEEEKGIYKIDEDNKIIKVLNLQKGAQAYTRGWDNISFIKCNTDNMENGYYLDTGSYMIYNLNKNNYKQQFSIPLSDFMQIVDQADSSVYQKRDSIEGKISVFYCLEIFLAILRGK